MYRKYKAWGYQHGVLPRLLWPLLIYELQVSLQLPITSVLEEFKAAKTRQGQQRRKSASSTQSSEQATNGQPAKHFRRHTEGLKPACVGWLKGLCWAVTLEGPGAAGDRRDHHQVTGSQHHRSGRGSIEMASDPEPTSGQLTSAWCRVVFNRGRSRMLDLLSKLPPPTKKGVVSINW